MLILADFSFCHMGFILYLHANCIDVWLEMNIGFG
jgi:hypothetical protein